MNSNKQKHHMERWKNMIKRSTSNEQLPNKKGKANIQT